MKLFVFPFIYLLFVSMDLYLSPVISRSYCECPKEVWSYFYLDRNFFSVFIPMSSLPYFRAVYSASSLSPSLWKPMWVPHWSYRLKILVERMCPPHIHQLTSHYPMWVKSLDNWCHLEACSFHHTPSVRWTSVTPCESMRHFFSFYNCIIFLRGI